jgi:hypothetical protein
LKLSETAHKGKGETMSDASTTLRPVHLARTTVIAGLLLGGAAVGLWAQESDKKNAQLAPDGWPMEARLADHSVLRIQLLEEKIEVQTRYGKLTVPAGDIRRIDLGLRLPPGTARKIDAAVASLGSTDFKQREKGSKELIGLKELAFPAVQRASKDSDLEVARRAQEVLARLKETVGGDKLTLRDWDLVYTEEFTIPGHIQAAAFKTRSSIFGEVRLQLTELRGLRSLRPGGATELVVDAARYALAAGQEKWLDTRIEFTQGSNLHVTAEGEIDVYPVGAEINSYIVGPKGPKRWGRDAGPAMAPPAGSLLGKIGGDGKEFVVGEKFDDAAPASGRLLLRVIGSPWNVGCTGSYTVQVRGGTPAP